MDELKTRRVEIKKENSFKRVLDVLLSLTGLVLSSPIWLAVATAIKLDDGGPVFYRQLRWGRGGERFWLYKFRTMIADSDARFGIAPAGEKDLRITPVGRLLRATGMDELPQFINILKGDMSFVGPRALAIGEVLAGTDGHALDYEDVEGFSARLQVRPGLTGMATIYIPKDSPPSTKLEYDLRYVDEQSLWLDMKLIALSLWISIRGRWETREPKTRSR